MATKQLEADIERQIRAMNFGCSAHGAQMYGKHSYVRHLAHVESVLLRFGFYDSPLLAAAWLHDSIEDANVTWRQIDEMFGEEVAMLVFAVTDGEGANRKERKQASYAKMRDYPKAIILKLADRIANVESSMIDNGSLLGMYTKEYPSFRETLRAASFVEAADCTTRLSGLWSYLDGLMEQPSTLK